MSLTSALLQLADRYCEHLQRSRSRVATIIFNDGKALDRIAGGGDLNTRSFERAMAWFSANWPADLAWPEGIERPLSVVPRAGDDSLPRAGGLVSEGVQP